MNLDTYTENVFTENFPIFAVDKNLGAKLKNACYNVPFEHPCENVDHQYLLKLFIRFKIFSSVTFLNGDLISVRKLRNRKLAKDSKVTERIWCLKIWATRF